MSMVKTYWIDGKELESFSLGYALEKQIEILDILGVLHKKLEIKEVPCWCTRTIISQDESLYHTHKECPYHTTHTTWGKPLNEQ